MQKRYSLKQSVGRKLPELERVAKLDKKTMQTKSGAEFINSGAWTGNGTLHKNVHRNGSK